jgi:hypothetical protein
MLLAADVERTRAAPAVDANQVRAPRILNKSSSGDVLCLSQRNIEHLSNLKGTPFYEAYVAQLQRGQNPVTAGARMTEKEKALLQKAEGTPFYQAVSRRLRSNNDRSFAAGSPEFARLGENSQNPIPEPFMKAVLCRLEGKFHQKKFQEILEQSNRMKDPTDPDLLEALEKAKGTPFYHAIIERLYGADSEPILNGAKPRF